MNTRLRTWGYGLCLLLAAIAFIAAYSARFPVGGRFFLTARQLSGAPAGNVQAVSPVTMYQTGDRVAYVGGGASDTWHMGVVELISLVDGTARVGVRSDAGERVNLATSAFLGRIDFAVPHVGPLVDGMRHPVGIVVGLVLPLALLLVAGFAGSPHPRQTPPHFRPPSSGAHTEGKVSVRQPRLSFRDVPHPGRLDGEVRAGWEPPVRG